MNKLAAQDLASRGWARFAPDLALAPWVAAARLAAQDAIRQSPDPWRCGDTWFAGVDALPNDAAGAVAGTASGTGAGAAVALRGAAIDTVHAAFAPLPLHRAQLSVTRPGYPQPWSGESDQAFGYRLRRDAAHLDGLLPIGPSRRRMLREPHAFILGLPLTGADPQAAPLALWEGSHRIMRRALAAALADIAPSRWADTDITDAYHAARREVFQTCTRLTLQPMPGETLLVHRLTLHGIAPWADGAGAPPEGRMIAYFRPEFPAQRLSDWLFSD